MEVKAVRFSCHISLWRPLGWGRLWNLFRFWYSIFSPEGQGTVRGLNVDGSGKGEAVSSGEVAALGPVPRMAGWSFVLLGNTFKSSRATGSCCWSTTGSGEHSPSPEQRHWQSRQSSEVRPGPLRGAAQSPRSWTFLIWACLVLDTSSGRGVCAGSGFWACWAAGSMAEFERGQLLRSMSESGSSGCLEEKESESAEGWPCHPRAPAGLWEKVWSKSCSPGLLSECGHEIQSQTLMRVQARFYFICL